MLENNTDINMVICKFLLDCRNAVHCTTGKIPTELHLNMKLNNTFDLILKQITNNNYSVLVMRQLKLIKVN